MDETGLPPQLERYAADGRCRDRAEIVAAAVELLRRRDAARADLLASVLAAQEEGDRLGRLTAEEVAAHVRETIARRTGAAA